MEVDSDSVNAISKEAFKVNYLKSYYARDCSFRIALGMPLIKIEEFLESEHRDEPTLIDRFCRKQAR